MEGVFEKVIGQTNGLGLLKTLLSLCLLSIEDKSSLAAYSRQWW